MYEYIGKYALYFSILATLGLFLIKLFKNDHYLQNRSRYLNISIVSTVLIWISFFTLMFAFIYHDYRFEAVYQNSSNDMSLSELIMASWASRQGVMILWAAFMCTISSFVLYFLRDELDDTIVNRSVTITLFFTFLIASFAMSSRPGAFDLVNEGMTNGFGLPPSLRSPWMELHPPIAFLGYSVFIVPYAISLAALSLYKKRRLLSQRLRWLNDTSMFLGWTLITLMIVAGSIWGYEENWNGFWAWDPVELASLILWLASTIYFHTKILVGNDHPLQYLVGSLGWLGVTFAALIIRSGVLSGLHNYTGTVLTIVFGILFLGTLLGIIFAAIKSGASFIPENFYEFRSHKKPLNLAGWWVLVAAIILNFMGLIMQIINVLFMNNENIPYAYYIFGNGILLFSLLALMSLSESSRAKVSDKVKISSFVLGSIIIGVLLYSILNHAIFTFIITGVLFGLFSILLVSMGKYLYKTRNTKQIGIFMSHVAVFLLLIPYFTVDYSTNLYRVNAIPGETIEIEELDIFVTPELDLTKRYVDVIIHVQSTHMGENMEHTVVVQRGEYKGEPWARGAWISYTDCDLYFHVHSDNMGIIVDPTAPIELEISEKPVPYLFDISFYFLVIVLVLGTIIRIRKIPAKPTIR